MLKNIILTSNAWLFNFRKNLKKIFQKKYLKNLLLWKILLTKFFVILNLNETQKEFEKYTLEF